MTSDLIALLTQEAVEEGRVAERRALVSRQLQRTLGPLSEELSTRAQALAGDALELLAEALPDFASVDDLRAWLDANAAV